MTDTFYSKAASNLSDVASASTARTNLAVPGLATANTMTADQYFKSGRPWFDVVAFGADPSGAADSTPFIQAAIDAATGSASPSTTTRAGLGSVFIPAGTYKVTGDLNIRSVLGFRFMGAGRDQAILKCSGTGFTNGPLNIDGSWWGKYEDFSITGDGTENLPNGILITWTSASATSTSGNTFSNIHIRGANFVNGVNVSSVGAGQDDGNVFRDVLVTGQNTAAAGWANATYWQHGFVLGDGTYGNNYDHFFYGSSANECVTGFYGNVCGFAVHDCEMAQNSVDFKVTPTHWITLSNIESENSGQFLVCTGSNIGKVNATNVAWSSGWAISSGYWIDIQGGQGPYVFSSVYGTSSNVALIVHVNPSGQSTAVTIQDLHQFATPQAGVIVGGSATKVVLINYIQTTASGNNVIGTVYPLMYYSGTAWWDATSAITNPLTSADVHSVTATGSYTWTKPVTATAQTVDVVLLGGGGGGGSGAIQTTGNAGGGGGGSGGGVTSRTFAASDLPSSVTGTVGAGGAGGGAVSGTSASSGNAGVLGGSTTFGVYADAYPGLAGAAGTATGGAGGGANYGTAPGSAGGIGGTGNAAGTGSFPAGGATGGGGGGGAATGGAGAGGGTGYPVQGNTANVSTGGVVGGASPTAGTQPTVKGTPSCGGGGGAGTIAASGTAQTGATAFNGGGGGGGGAAFIPTFSYTATNASPCVFTAAGSAYTNTTTVVLSGASTPAGFSNGTTYYVVSASGTSFSLAATSGGTAINSTSTGSGTVAPTTASTSGAGGAGGPGFSLIITHFA